MHQTVISMQMQHRPTLDTLHRDALPALAARVRFPGPEPGGAAEGAGEVDQDRPSAPQARERIERGIVVVPREECPGRVFVDPDLGVERRMGAEDRRREMGRERAVQGLRKRRGVGLEPIYSGPTTPEIARRKVPRKGQVGMDLAVNTTYYSFAPLRLSPAAWVPPSRAPCPIPPTVRIPRHSGAPTRASAPSLFRGHDEGRTSRT